MTYLPQVYFGDISVDEMKEIVDRIEETDEDLALGLCESLSHREHHGEIWQCVECLRLLCWNEGHADAGGNLCNDCWVRLGSERRVVAFA